MAHSSKDHPYGVCEKCGCDLWNDHRPAGAELCYECERRYRAKREASREAARVETERQIRVLKSL